MNSTIQLPTLLPGEIPLPTKNESRNGQMVRQTGKKISPLAENVDPLVPVLQLIMVFTHVAYARRTRGRVRTSRQHARRRQRGAHLGKTASVRTTITKERNRNPGERSKCHVVYCHTTKPSRTTRALPVYRKKTQERPVAKEEKTQVYAGTYMYAHRHKCCIGQTKTNSTGPSSGSQRGRNRTDSYNNSTSSRRRQSDFQHSGRGCTSV